MSTPPTRLRVCHTCQGVPEDAASPLEQILRAALPPDAPLVVERLECLECCERGAGQMPVMIDEVLYVVDTREDIARLAREHIGEGRVVEDLRLEGD